ncbi:hypothetical protein RB595_004277 [Gaeumannomyces hyphopodioides]
MAPDGAPRPAATHLPPQDAPSPKQQRSPRLEKALDELKRTLNKEQRAEFAKCSKQDVEDAIKSIQDTLGKQKHLQNFARFTKILRMVGHLAIIAGDVASAAGQAGFFWAPIRHVLDQLIRRGGGADCLERVVDMLAKISHIFPDMEDYQSLYSKHPAMRVILEDCCETIIRFNVELMEVFNKKGWHAMFDSSWRRFSKNTADMASTLEHNSKLLSEGKQTATMRMTHENQELLERTNRLLKERRLYKSGTKSWLLTDKRFTAWANLDDKTHRAMDLNGCPGAGKSCLVSSVVQHLQELQATSGQTPFSLAYFYFKHNSEDKTTFKHALQALISQLVTEESDEALLGHAFQVLSAVYKPSQEQLERLAATAIQAKRFSFVVLDGLDECNDDDQSKLVCWLKKQTTKGGGAPFTLRILLSGRREGHLDRDISSLPSILSVSVDESDRHKAGIRLYVEAKARYIRDTFGVGDKVEQSITERVVPHTKGMFLFAFVMVEYLSGLDCVKDLEEELQSQDFPEGLDQAYERVARKVAPSDDERAALKGIMTVPSKGHRDRAKNLLSWVSCAVRPLYWREAQARFMINPRAGPEWLAVNKMLIPSPKQLCGCLVDLTTVTSDGPKEAVQIVHRTASEYLERSGRIPSAGQQHVDMLTFCCQYLKSPAFSAPVPQTTRQEHAMTGYYAFQEYAASYWHDHAILLRQFATTLPLETVRPALEALSGFLNASFKGTGNEKDKTTLHGLDPDSKLLDNVAGLNPEPSEWNKLFLVQSWISLTREAIKAARRGTRDPQDADLEKFYGPERFKCPRPWCDFFHLGFREQAELEQHTDAHIRPFKCNVEGCEVSSLGFESKPALDRHKERFHKPRSDDELFPRSASSKGDLHTQLSRAIKEGRLVKVKEMVTPQNLREVFHEKNGRIMAKFTPLLHAIRCSQFRICKYLLESGAKVIYKGRDNDVTPIREAIKTGDTAILDLLLDYVPETEEPASHLAKSDIGGPLSDPLLDGLILALTLGNEGLVSILLKKVNLDSISTFFNCFKAILQPRNNAHLFPLLRQHIPLSLTRGKNDDGQSILSLAAGCGSPEIITSLIAEGGWDINERCSWGKTPLSYAAENGRLAALRVILEVDGVELEATCQKRWTPHRYAASKGHLECLKALCSADPSEIDGPAIFDKTNYCPTTEGKLECLKALLDISPTSAEWVGHDGETMYHYAVINGRSECLKGLFDVFPTGIQRVDGYGDTPYHIAAAKGDLECLKALFDVFPTGAQSAGQHGKSPLYVAVDNLKPDCVRWLLSLPGGNTEVTRLDPRGRSLLNSLASQVASSCENDAVAEIVRLLLEYMPDLADLPDKDGWCPLHNLVDSQQLEPETLDWVIPLAHAANPNLTTIAGRRGLYPGGITALEMALRAPKYFRPERRKFLLGVADAILSTGNFDFSALDRERRRALLSGITPGYPQPTTDRSLAINIQKKTSSEPSLRRERGAESDGLPSSMEYRCQPLRTV